MGRSRWVAALAAGWLATGMAQDVPCRQIAGQAEIDGMVQLITGLACLQPDGTWQLVDNGGYGYGDVPVYAVPPGYYASYAAPYWAPYGVGVVFIDRFRQFHPMHHVMFHRAVHFMGWRGVPRVGGYGGGSFYGGRTFRGGGNPSRGGYGGFHGSGMAHR